MTPLDLRIPPAADPITAAAKHQGADTANAQLERFCKYFISFIVLCQKEASGDKNNRISFPGSAQAALRLVLSVHV